MRPSRCLCHATRSSGDPGERVPRVGTVGDITELEPFYARAPAGVRANMIFSADGAAAFGGRAGPLSCPVDQQLLEILRGFADVVLVGAGTARAENYGPVRLTDTQQATRRGEGGPPAPDRGGQPDRRTARQIVQRP